MNRPGRGHIEFPLIIRLSLALHLLWAVLLWQEPQLGLITALYLLPFSAPVLSGLLAVISLLAGWPFVRQCSRRTMLLCFFPQQVCLYISACGAMLAAWNGTYGDGILHPRLFIFGDQFPVALLAYYHTRALISVASDV